MAAFLTNVFNPETGKSSGDDAARAESLNQDPEPTVEDNGGGASDGQLDGAFEQEQSSTTPGEHGGPTYEDIG